MPGPVKDWRTRLAWELRAARRLIVLGVGNLDRADDGAGSLCAQQLERLLARSPRPAGQSGRTKLEALQVLDGGEVPESATGVIRNFRPTHVLIIDAAALRPRARDRIFHQQEEDPRRRPHHAPHPSFASRALPRRDRRLPGGPSGHRAARPGAGEEDVAAGKSSRKGRRRYPRRLMAAVAGPPDVRILVIDFPRSKSRSAA